MVPCVSKVAVLDKPPPATAVAGHVSIQAYLAHICCHTVFLYGLEPSLFLLENPVCHKTDTNEALQPFVLCFLLLYHRRFSTTDSLTLIVTAA